ncbi:MAG: hypothetical protein JNK05_26480 [Myxococcales bacterium]|nr:hypothetical protein [Myxococcales bacterium]
MRTLRAKAALIVCAGAAALVATRDVEACRALAPGGCDAFNTAATFAPVLTVGAVLALPSLAIDGMTLGWYVRTGTIPIGWPVLGSVVWGAHSIAAVASFGVAVWAQVPGMIALSAVYAGVSLASLGVSIWAFSAPRPQLAPRVALAPWWTREGAGLTLGASF